MGEENFAEVIKRRLISKKTKIGKSNTITNPPKPEFAVGQPVLIMYNSRCSAGIVMSMRHMFNWREVKYCWGYEIDFKAERVGPEGTHIPEDYLREVRDHRERIPNEREKGGHMFK